MLFHVTMTHTADNCPAYHTDHMPKVIASLENLENVARDLNVKIHTILWGAPDHVAYAVVETNDITSLGRLLNSIAIAQEFKITPVQFVSEVIEFGKAAMAK